MAIIEQEARPLEAERLQVTVPDFMTEIVAEISQHARQSPHVNQRSGVSARLSIANYETLVANAARRALANGEREVVPRVSDLDALVASTSGKIEIEMLDDGRDSQVLDRIMKSAVLEVFRARVKPELLGPSRRRRSKAARSCTPAKTSPSSRVRRSSSTTLDGLKPLLADLGVGRVAGRVRVGHRVRARRPAPHQAPEQGRARRPRRVPRTRLSGDDLSLQVLALGRHAGRLRPRRRRAALEEMTDDLLYHGDLNAALRRMMQQGFRTATAATSQACARCSSKLRQQRREQLDRYDLGGVYEDIAQPARRDRRAGARRHRPARRRGPRSRATSAAKSSSTISRRSAASELDELPPDLAGRVQELQQYDWMDDAARQRFEELMEELKKQLLDNMFNQLQQGMSQMSAPSRSRA